MADLQIEDELAATLYQLAARENLSIEALLQTLVQRYRFEKDSEPIATTTETEGWRGEALDKFVGMFDEDIHDLSESVHDSVTDAIRKKHARLD